MILKGAGDSTNTSKKKNGVLTECKTFMETSSVKGMSRIIKSQTGCLKGTWLVVTVCCVTISLFTCTDICRQYMEYPSVVKVVEYNGWNMDEWQTVIEKYETMLLSVTLCNHKYTSSAAEKLSEGVLTPVEFHTRLHRKYGEVLNSTVLMERYGKQGIEMVWQNLQGSGYIQTIPVEELEKLGHKMEDFIVACHFYVTVASGIKAVPCSDIAEFYSLLTESYLFCYTIAPTMKIYDYGIPYALSITLYLDTFENAIPLTFDDTSPMGQEAGVRFVPHRQNILPRIIEDGLSVSPGQHVTYNAKFIGIDRLYPPYTKCIKDKELELYNMKNISIKYQKEHCYFGCLEKEFLEQCGCRSLSSKVKLGPWPKNTSLILPCGHVFWENISKTLERAMCIFSVTTEKSQMCSKLCQQPCTELLFEKRSVSDTKWPVPAAIPALYLENIQNKPHGYRFSEYGEIISQWRQQNISQDEMIRKIRQPRLIEENYVKISIVASSLDVLSYETVPSLTFSTMLSSVGGALNLYAGLTIIFIFEIIEFLFKLAWTYRLCLKKNDLTKVRPM